MINETRNVRFKAASDIAYNFILGNITSGHWKPGISLVENEITDSLGISRTPVREACIRLVTENYLEKLPNNRLRVALVSSKQLREIYTVRSFLEEKIIEELIRNLTNPQIDDLARIVSYLQVSVENRNTQESIHFMDQFHEYLAKVLENDILLDTLQVINGHIARYRSLLVSEVKRIDLESICENHKKIYESILQQNAELARRLMLSWNKTSHRFLEKTLIKLGYF